MTNEAGVTPDTVETEARSEAPGHRPELIVDAVLHPYNFSPGNARNEIAATFGPGTYAILSVTGDDELISREEYLKDWTIDELADIVFTESDTDLAVYHGVPWFDYFNDGLVSNEKGIEMRRRWPDRVMFYGTLDPLREDAVETVEYLVKEAGACGIKLYPENWYYSEARAAPILLDQPNVAPVLEKTMELGVPLAIHKAVPAGHGIFDNYRVGDVEQAAMRYPDLQIEVVHSGAAFLQETAYMLERYSNVWANLEVTSAWAVKLKRRFAEALGVLLTSGAADRIIYATGCVLVHPQPVLEAFYDFQMPADLTEGYGYPPVDQATMDGIMGLNFARLHNLDAKAKLAAIEGDEFDQRRAGGLAPRWSAAKQNAGVPV